MTKQEILDAIQFLEDRPPSKWDLAFIVRVKAKLLPKIKEYINDDIVAKAKDIFGA